MRKYPSKNTASVSHWSIAAATLPLPNMETNYFICGWQYVFDTFN